MPIPCSHCMFSASSTLRVSPNYVANPSQPFFLSMEPLASVKVAPFFPIAVPPRNDLSPLRQVSPPPAFSPLVYDLLYAAQTTTPQKARSTERSSPSSFVCRIAPTKLRFRPEFPFTDVAAISRNSPPPPQLGNRFWQWIPLLFTDAN